MMCNNEPSNGSHLIVFLLPPIVRHLANTWQVTLDWWVMNDQGWTMVQHLYLGSKNESKID